MERNVLSDATVLIVGIGAAYFFYDIGAWLTGAAVLAIAVIKGIQGGPPITL